MQCEIVELKFKGSRRDLFANPGQLSFKVGDSVIVQADNGLDFGKINHVSSLLKQRVEEGQKLKKVIRKASSADLEKQQQNEITAEKALKVGKETLQQHTLKMKLVDCEFQFDGRKITFHFTAENRVDFRKLVKDIARIYHTRIEFRQIGVRDAARRLGGYGVCGRSLCCSTWIRDFTPVTTQAAKEQNLSLNPSKLAGVCGRLKCCLMFERDFYNMAVKQFPQLAKPITTEKGEGIVSNIDILGEKFMVLYPDDTTETLGLDYLKQNVYKCEHDCGHEHGNLEELN